MISVKLKTPFSFPCINIDFFSRTFFFQNTQVLTLVLFYNRLIVIPKIGKRVNNRQHFFAEIGQTVFDAQRHFTVISAVNKTVGNHLLQAVGKNLLRNSVKIPLKLVESPRSGFKVAKNQKLPFSANQRNRGCNRTSRQFIFCFHAFFTSQPYYSIHYKKSIQL